MNLYNDCLIHNQYYKDIDEHIDSCHIKKRKYCIEDFIKHFEILSEQYQMFLQTGKDREIDPFFEFAKLELPEEEYKKLLEAISGKPKIKRQNFKRRRFRRSK